MDITFLQTVVSTSGWNCITEIHPKKEGGTWARNNPIKFADANATAALIQNLQAGGVETYFGLATYAQPTPDGSGFRTQQNTLCLRSFWLDIDAGEAKFAKHGESVYRTQHDALTALAAEVAKGLLPQPTYVVSSGEGLHVYWSCLEDIPPAEWRMAADKLGRYCANVGLRVDSSRTTDSASVLRPVGTIHFKSGKPVQILTTGSLFYKQDLLGKFMALPVANSLMSMQAANPLMGLGAMPSYAAGVANSSMGTMGDYKPASFGKIIDRQKYERTGCAQLLWAYEHQQEADEPTWFGALSVAQFCTVDRDEWIHKLSHLHPDYERGKTEAKAAQAKGPKSCAHFEAQNPDRCKGCPHYGKITNPIVLGYEPQNRPTIVITPVSSDHTQTDTFLVPELPWGFYRGAEGGVYTNVPKLMPDGKKSKDEMVAFEVCRQDTYIFERVKDTGKQLYLCRYHSPHDGVVEFQLDSTNINSQKEFKDAITGAGLPIDGNEQWKQLMTFFNRARTKLINDRPAVTAVAQMGWQENGKDFVLGDTVIGRTGARPAPLGDREVARKHAKAFRPSSKGDDADAQVELWRNLLREMYGHPAAVANQFVIATALGAPFSSKYALESHAGGVISLSSSGSGRGKTFTCQTALRVFGDPSAVTFSSKDGTTIAGLMTNLGYLNSLPLLRDEVTEMTSEEIVNMVYDSTRLGDKERAQGSDNDIRGNRNTWRTFFYATANTSLYDMVTQGRDVADGPIRRITEITIPELTYLRDADRARQLAQRLHTIKGVAGYRLIEWMVNHDEQAQALWNNISAYFVKAYNVTNEERYWVNHLVSGCVGAVIGDQLGLLPFEPAKIFEYAGGLLAQLRARVGYRVLEQQDYLSQFFIDNVDHTLTIGVAVTDDFTMTGAELPRRSVYIRVEVPHGMAYINSGLIKSWCASRRVVLADFEHQLIKRGGKAGQMKRMLANTVHASSTEPQKVWAVPINQQGVST